jgi:hypothetical protein
MAAIRLRRRTVVVALVALLGVPLVLLTAAWGTLAAGDTGTVSPSARSSGHDALWMGHAWVDGRRGQAEVDALAERLRRTGIRDLFVHAGPLSYNGGLDPRLDPRARWLTGQLHRLLPGVRVQAWLGDIVGPGHLDLQDPGTRARILASDRQILGDGFDGIHYDLEPVGDGDPGYLALLTASHVMLGAGHKTLSIAVDQIEPVSGLRVPEQWIFSRPHWWSSGYLHAVATRVDEVALMTYDTGMQDRASYTGYVRRETGLALAAVPPTVTVLMGVPAYYASSLGHNGSAETVGAALRGIRLAIGPGQVRRPFGVALYADYSATFSDWNTYKTHWDP